MAFAIVDIAVPDEITAGESASWKFSDTRFPASIWTLTYTLVNAGGRIQIVAGADGDDHLVEVAATVSAAYTPGEYDWQAHVSNGTERYQVAAGVVLVVADFATHGSGYDSRGHVKKVLDALEAAIEGRASKVQMSQTVSGVAISYMTLDELVRMRDKYRAKYERELVASGAMQSRRLVRPRFVN